MKSVKTFFKRYWFNILLIAGYILLDFFIIPLQEQEYVDADRDLIKNYAGISVMIIGGLLAVLAIGFGVRSAKDFVSVLSVLLGGVGIFVLMLICVKPFFISGYYLVNKFYAKEQIERKYTLVNYQQGERYWLLRETKTGDLLSSRDYPFTADLPIKNDSDTVRIRFTKGLLGINYSPEVLTNIEE